MNGKAAEEPLARTVEFDADRMLVQLADGRELAVPLDWFPKLRDAKPRVLRRWHLIGGGVGIHWPLLDEDVSVRGLLMPRPTRHAQARSPARVASRSVHR